MRFISLFSCLIFFTSITTAQDAQEEIVQNVYRLLSNANSYEGVPYYALNTRNAKVVGGSEFLEKDWKEGLVVTHQDSLYRIIGRYDAHNDEMQILLGEDLKSLSPTAIKGVAINDKIFITLPYLNEKKKTVGYFELLVEGNKPLLCRYHATTQNASNHPVLGNVDGAVKIVIKEQLYYGQKGKVAMKLSKSRKDFLATFNKQSSKMERYMKKHKLHTRKKEDVIKIFQYYNESSL